VTSEGEGGDIKTITPPLSDEDVDSLRIGTKAKLTGTIYAARDAAHKRLIELLDQGKELPVDLRGQIIYYVGPSPPKPDQVIGSAGPTTSSRMDAYAPRLIEYGLKGMIGKGTRSANVLDAMKKHGAIYFIAVGGAAALLAKRIKEADVVAYEDLGTEALRVLKVEDFPVVVANDSHGGDLYKEGVSKYSRL
jgi:fumarate hydratase subunit beta